ncbi:MAG: UDP-N-acetylmuramate--L-alanine ligase [Clostridia bacterium]|nr:UDP-N-acetylmuramate--L-alanine ligase [Clostridia bacterium]
MYKSFHTKEEIADILKAAKKIFFVGIGGVSMSSLAHISAENGFEVAGSDRTRSEICERFEKKNIKVYYTHDGENIRGCDAIVYSAAIAEDNPELVAAEKTGIPLIYRADYLGYIMSKYERRIGISGMHGKSTTTSMSALIFMEAGDPTVVSGAVMHELEGGTYRSGTDGNFVMEACEYCDSFLSFTPNIAVILNIEMDHPDYFSDLDHIKRSFASYAKIAGDGYVVANGDDFNVREALKEHTGRIIYFGLGENADYRAVNISYNGAFPCFDIEKNGKYFMSVKLSVTGEHNIMNALASAVAADLCGIDTDIIARGLYKFKGAARRMEFKGRLENKADIFEDYAHHPTEIRTTLAGVKKLAKGDIWCVFQPHTYSRTFNLFDDFAASFGGVKAIFSDIYAAREVNTFGVSSKQLADRVKDAVYIEDLEKIAGYLRKNVKEDDMIIVMGAGDINKLCALLED